MKNTSKAGTGTSVRDHLTSMRRGIDRNLRSNPMKWGGIATGVGLALGLAGRWMRTRSRRKPTTAYVLLEAC